MNGVTNVEGLPVYTGVVGLSIKIGEVLEEFSIHVVIALVFKWFVFHY